MTAIVTQRPALEMSEQERFFRFFQNEVTALQEQMQIIEDHGTSGGERADAIDHCLAGIARLSNEVKDVSGSLPAHDQRTYSEAIKALSEKLQKTRALAAPKPKFQFKSGFPRKNASAISLNDAAELAAAKRLIPATNPSVTTSLSSSWANTPAMLSGTQTPLIAEDEDDGTSKPVFKDSPQTPDRIRKPSFSNSSTVQISNHSKVHIMLPPSAQHATTSGTLSNIKESVIDMSISVTSAFAALYLKNIKKSLIVCGHVDGAVHITGLKDCTLVVATRQFRMHESSGVDVYLLCASRPIIEDCSDIQFAPLPLQYMTQKDTLIKNQFDQVDDFKWLKADHSPNWSIMAEEDRASEDVWRTIVPGGPNISVQDILKATEGG